mmetsp:Transcript_103353/g.267319  ORF Transcript_103353/g.267319 Transcript_103353/m.267319 type:complete len:313 (-) Transcript_103353:99-1037(-)
MATLQVDSLDVPALGRQYDSKKDTMPAFSFGSGTRDAARLKVYISAKHEKGRTHMTSPGPVYANKTAVGNTAKHSFGTDENRKHAKAKYPDSSVDLTCSIVDSQGVKFKGTPSVHFGTEARMNANNGELLRGQPLAGYGLESPGALEYFPERSEPKVSKAPPAYSFGTGFADDKKGTATKAPTRMKPLSMLSTPRHVGPGSHPQPPGIGTQPVSARSSAPSWSFGQSPRDNQSQDVKQLLDVSPDLSSLGKQVVSGQKSMPRHSFGTSTREGMSRTQVVMSMADRGPVANMPKPVHSFDLPKPGRCPPKAGM